METLDQRRVLVTGATDGIGLGAAQQLANRGTAVVLHGRNQGKLRAASELCGGAPTLAADLASLAEVRGLVQAVSDLGPLDVLVNNAGVGAGAPGDGRQTSRDGYELRLAVNFLAPFALTEWLLALGRCPPIVINVASIGQAPVDLDDLMLNRCYEGWHAYRRSKLALVAWSVELSRRHPELFVIALHPGTLLDTKMVRESEVRPRGPVETGAQAIEHAILEALAGRTGVYYDVLEPARANAQAYDAEFAARLVHAAGELIAPFSRG